MVVGCSPAACCPSACCPSAVELPAPFAAVGSAKWHAHHLGKIVGHAAACCAWLLQKIAEREERERRRAEAARAKEEAKRYPMEDLELLEELRQRALEGGEALECTLSLACRSVCGVCVCVCACVCSTPALGGGGAARRGILLLLLKEAP